MNYTPTATGTHTSRLLLSGDFDGSRGVSLRGECLPVPTLSACTATAPTNIESDRYTANWTAPANETIDYFVVTRTHYANEAFEAFCQQRLVDGYAGHTCVVDEHHVAQRTVSFTDTAGAPEAGCTTSM